MPSLAGTAEAGPLAPTDEVLFVGSGDGWAVPGNVMLPLPGAADTVQQLRVLGGSAKSHDRVREEFQLLVGGSWERRIYPADAEGSGQLRLGEPSPAAEQPGCVDGRNWAFEGRPGDAFRVLFDRREMTVAAVPVDLQRARLRGVNLGGWLVLERWMAPQLFDDLAPAAQDELSLLSSGGEHAAAEVQAFRKSFIQLADFEWLAGPGGVNAVRLPVGFWCLEEHAQGTPFLPTAQYVDSVFDWAEASAQETKWRVDGLPDFKATGLGVVLDFHAAVGSQNGEHHSGCSGRGVRWLEGANRRRNLEVLESWASRWGRRKALLAFGLGNEVAKPDALSTLAEGGLRGWLSLDTLLCRRCRGLRPASYWDEVAGFYAEAARRVRPHLPEELPLVIDTCWDTSRFLLGRLKQVPGPIWLDYHHYECFGATEQVGAHCQARDLQRQLLAQRPAGGSRPPPSLLLGEFSLALKPESPGYEREGWQREFFRQQTRLAEHLAVGWFFWSYKMARQGWAHWSYRECVELGWIAAAP